MNKLFLLFNVQGQKLTCGISPTIMEGTNKFIHAKFNFSPEWEGMNKFALVARANQTYTIALDENDECLISRDAIRTSGAFDLGVVGTNSNDVKITTNAITVEINSTEFQNNPVGSETRLTSDFLTNTLQSVKENADAAALSKSAAQYAAEHVNMYIPEMDGTVLKWTNLAGKPNPDPVDLKGEKGDRGLKGDQGDRGERGLQGIQGMQGIQGERGLQGIQGLKGDDAVFVGNTEPTNESIKLWIKPDATNPTVEDIQINGTSIVESGVANIPIATTNLGVVKQNLPYGIGINVRGELFTYGADENSIINRSSYRPIDSNRIDLAVKYAMCDGKGAAWTEEERAHARERMGVDCWELVADITLEEETQHIILLSNSLDVRYKKIMACLKFPTIPNNINRIDLYTLGDQTTDSLRTFATTYYNANGYIFYTDVSSGLLFGYGSTNNASISILNTVVARKQTYINHVKFSLYSGVYPIGTNMILKGVRA